MCKIICALLLMTSPLVGGDCQRHPLWILEVEVTKCEPASFSNTESLRAHHSAHSELRTLKDPQKLEKQFPITFERKLKELTNPIVVIDASIKRKRFAGDEFEAGKPWELANGNVERFLMRARCEDIKLRNRTKLAKPTHCGCDTGADGACIFKEEAFVQPITPLDVKESEG